MPLTTEKEILLFEHQQQVVEELPKLPQPTRACLYFKTGSGKSMAALLGIKELGHTFAVVVAPPSTHLTWMALAERLGMSVMMMSHAKFRMQRTRLSRSEALIADEFHMFGGTQGRGWRKLEGFARVASAPILLLSATPNYNDAERVYCVQRILSPGATKGGFLQFLYENCHTEQNPFGTVPKVTGFKDYANACDFLADLPKVFYLEDDLEYTIEDIHYQEEVPPELSSHSYNRRDHKIVGSDIEMRHTVRLQGLIDKDSLLRDDVYQKVLELWHRSAGTAMVYCNHSTVARALAGRLDVDYPERRDYSLVTGLMTTHAKTREIQEFIEWGGMLIGTAAIATGTDGLDKVCDTLIILDDTEDDALRRQLIGRIMPRGGGSQTDKKVYRFLPF